MASDTTTTPSETSTMDDARRFIRYIVPGVLLGTETGLLLLLILPSWTLRQFAFIKQDGALAVVLGSLLASGGLGFILATIHHALHWSIVSDYGLSPSIDHSGNHEALERDGKPEWIGDKTSGHEPMIRKSGRWSRERAWILTSVRWYQYKAIEKGAVAAADARTVALTDLAHSLGTARIAATLAPVAAFVVASQVGTFSRATIDILRVMVALFLAALFWWVQHVNYRRTCFLAQSVIDGVLAEATLRHELPTVVDRKREGAEARL